MSVARRKKTKKKENETNACNALISILEGVVGETYVCERCPDEEATKGKDVDFILKPTRTKTARIAVEHTIVPLFNGQLNYVISSHERLEKINSLCQGKIPRNRYYFVTAPHRLIGSLKNLEKQKAFDKNLADWITQRAPHLQIDESEQHSYEDYEITLSCVGTHPRIDGSVRRIPEFPRDALKLQKEAFDKAVQHGLDKFLKYKCDPSKNFKTVLLLEDVAGLPHQRMMDGLTLSDKARIDELIDFIVVLKSSEHQMIVGNVWKENETWYRFIPAKRRFDFLRKN